MAVIVSVLRWIARLSALVVAGGYLVLVSGELLTPHSGPPGSGVEWIGIGLLSTTCLGMIVAWRWELPGAALSLGCLITFSMLIRMSHHTVLYVLAIPGTLFLADWALRQTRVRRWLTPNH
jgi:hypothetical protein